jgi:hypothetical protein
MTINVISGADLQVGQVIKSNGRIYKIVDIEPPDDIGARLADVELTNGEFQTINFFDDSSYELRSAPPRRRPQIVKVTLPPDLAARVERARLSSESTSQAIVRIVTQCLREAGL